MFDYMSSIPQILKDFNTFMGARKYLNNWFPVQERLLYEVKEES